MRQARLAADAAQANKVLAKLKIEKAKIYGDRKVAAADQPRRNRGSCNQPDPAGAP